MSAVDDTRALEGEDGAHTGTITHSLSASSGDGDYNDVTVPDVTVSITDDVFSELEGPIDSIGTDENGERTPTVMGITADISDATNASPTTSLTFDQLTDPTPLPGRGDTPGFKHGTVKTEGAERTEQLGRRERSLKRQNERLEEFASVVSHDLRNPLTVAEGRLALAREECESEHLDAVTDAHDRMSALIGDLLTLAREGDRLSETEAVDLADLSENCWRNVGTADATVRTPVDRMIQADRSRLAQLLENLIRNAIEHGGEDVTVTIGGLGDGFYVEDDGPGIPEDERDSVFDAGYSTADEGTGFGLSIVKQVADAHGWDIDVADGADGGARFEITGVGLSG